MRQTQEEWTRGKIPYDFFQFLEIMTSCGSTTCPIQYAVPVSCSMAHTYDSFDLQVIIPIPAANATAFVSDPIHFCYETEDQVCTIKYSSPDTMIVVDSCVMPGVDTLKHYYGMILMPNYSCDPDSTALSYVLNLFLPERCDSKIGFDWDKLSQVKVTNDHYYVYCPKGRIFIGKDEDPFLCPNDLIRFPIDTSFSIEGFNYYTGSDWNDRAESGQVLDKAIRKWQKQTLLLPTRHLEEFFPESSSLLFLYMKSMND